MHQAVAPVAAPDAAPADFAISICRRNTSKDIWTQVKPVFAGKSNCQERPGHQALLPSNNSGHLKSGTLRPLLPLAFDPMESPFNDRGVSVTRNALSAAGQVFPLREILNVRVVTVQKNKVLPVALAVIGLAGAIVGGVFRSPAGIVCGIMLAVVGWLTWSTQDVTHRLLVETSSGEREALSSIDLEFVERVAQAVRQTMAAAPAPGPAAAPQA
jgi:hypothetical protein